MEFNYYRSETYQLFVKSIDGYILDKPIDTLINNSEYKCKYCGCNDLINKIKLILQTDPFVDLPNNQTLEYTKSVSKYLEDIDNKFKKSRKRDKNIQDYIKILNDNNSFVKLLLYWKAGTK